MTSVQNIGGAPPLLAIKLRKTVLWLISQFFRRAVAHHLAEMAQEARNGSGEA